MNCSKDSVYVKTYSSRHVLSLKHIGIGGATHYPAVSQQGLQTCPYVTFNKPYAVHVRFKRQKNL